MRDTIGLLAKAGCAFRVAMADLASFFVACRTIAIYFLGFYVYN